MRARNNRSQNRRARKPATSPRWLNIPMMLLLLVSIVANFPIAIPVSAQQQDNTPPPLPAPSSVLVTGNFQDQLGCGNNDPNCPNTSLTLDDYGVWSGTFTITPGSYSFRVVANADQQRSIGEDGDPNSDDIDFDVPDDSTGVFFSYNQRTGETYAKSINQLTELQTDFGTQPMFPEADGDDFFALVNGGPGTAFNAQVLVNGEPVGNPDSFTIGNGSRIRITADRDGNLDSEDIEPAVLNITKTDPDGNPLTGACFSVYDGEDVAGQACDIDDGEDGITQIRFSLGVGNGLKLAESFTPDGQPVSEGQDIDLGPGVTDLVVTAGAGGIQTTDVTVTTAVNFEMQDADGNPIVGGCLEFGDLGQQCDDDQDGVIRFDNVPTNTTLDVNETQAPDGYEQFGGASIDVGEDEIQVPIQHTLAGGGVGNLTLYTVDENGNPVPGVCYDVTGVDGVQCDEDGDGDMGLTELPAGSYGAKQNSVPDGYQLDENEQSVNVEAGGDAELTFTSPSAQAETHQITIQAVDENGNAIGGACFTILDPDFNQLGDSCDDDQTGDAQFDLVDGDYLVAVTSVPDGFNAPDNVPFTVQGDDQTVTVTLPAVEVAEETPTEEVPSDSGSLNVSVTDADGFAIIGACISINGPASGEICDNGDGDSNGEDGFITIDGLPAGSYNIAVSQLPEGFDPAPPVDVTVNAGETADAQLISGESTPEEPTETPAPETGDLLIRKYDPDKESLTGSCFQLQDSGGNVVAEVCDGGDGDGDSRDGRIVISDLAPGDYVLVESQAPDGYTPGDPVPVSIVAGETARVNVTNQLSTGGLDVLTADGSGANVGGACYDLSGLGEQCDDNGDGIVSFSDVPAGDYTVTQTTVPGGYTGSDPADQSVSIGAGETAQTSFLIQIATGSVNVNVVDEGGNPVPGACFSLDGGDEFCDQGSGSVTFSDLPPGDHTIAMSTTPDGYQDGGSQDVTVTAGESVDVTFTLSVAPGRLDIVTQDADGNRIGGACYSINGGEAICDNDGNDGNDNDGVIRVANLAPGDYSLSQTQAPDGYSPAADTSFTIAAGERTRVDVTIAPAAGSVTISFIDFDSGEAITDGVCVIFPASAADGQTICDGDANDLNGDPGKIQIGNIAPGDYDLAIDSTTSNYVLDQSTYLFTVQAGQDTSLEITLQLVPPTETATEVPTETATEVPTETETAVPTETETTVPTETETETAVPEDTATETAVAEDTATETVAAEETATETEVVIIPPVETPTEAPEPTGSIRINVVDEDGNALVGACFVVDGSSAEICDNSAADLEPAEGIIEVGAVAAGDHTVSQTQAPDGYSPAADQTASIANDGDTAELTFTNAQTPVATGNLQITSTDADGNPIGGACYQLGTTEVCDNGAGDANSAPGVILIEGVLIGDYTVTETQAPEGFESAADQTVTIEADGTAELTFSHEATPPQTGGVEFNLTDADGNPAPESCVVLNGGNGAVDNQTFCDGGEEDTNGDPAVLKLEDLPTGSYSVVQSPPEDQQDAFASAALDTSNFTIQADQVVTVIVIIIVTPPTAGDLQITKRAADTNALQGGACFRVSGEGNEIEVCDNDDVDLNPTTGIIRLEDLQAGNYTISEITAPPGYQAAPDRNTTIPNGATRSVLIKDQPVTDTTGGLIVQKFDQNGDPLPGSCFQLRNEGVVVATVCDEDDGASDGVITFTDIEADDYRLRETRRPSNDFAAVPDMTVVVLGGVDDQVVEVVNTPKVGRIRVTKTTEDGTTLLPGACFGLDRGSGIEIEACDNGPGDTSGTLGIIQFSNVAPADWNLIETQSPDGYDAAADVPFTLDPGEVERITVVNQPTPPSSDRGTVIVNKLVDGELAPGACFTLRQGVVNKYSACDGANNDGIIEFPSVAVGNYTLHETKGPNPSSWFLPADDKDITVTKDTTTEVDIPNELRPGRILVIKRNTSGTLLQNACFKITPDPNSAGVRCTNASGTVSFDNLPTTSTYKLTETQAPNGYQVGNPISGISLTPGLTTSLNVVNKTTPPQPDSGSLLVIKFFCPAGKGGSTTSFLNTSTPGVDSLSQTEGCTRGDARFEFNFGGDGSTKYGFNTGTDGEFFTTLAAGDYTLTEVSPNKSDPQPFTIHKGQQTTIVVIDFVEPPAPKPGTVNVVKYTCDPGFGGVYYADFLNSCRGDSQLTNGITFRTSGPTVQQRVTGSTGQRGQTSFTQLQAGQYTLTEDGSSSSSTVYMFCGTDVYNYANWWSTGGSVNFPVAEGAVITCVVFNVPDDLSDTTGAIVVHKYVCAGENFPSGFDYFANCPVATVPVKFAISVKQGNTFQPKTTGITNANGLLSFGRLKPGTYALKEVGGDWCMAKSDNVDASGNLIVRAGQRTNVWIFNCEPTKQPPNTGSGSMASVISGGNSGGSAMAVMGLAWPMLGLIGFKSRRRFRRAA